MDVASQTTERLYKILANRDKILPAPRVPSPVVEKSAREEVAENPFLRDVNKRAIELTHRIETEEEENKKREDNNEKELLVQVDLEEKDEPKEAYEPPEPKEHFGRGEDEDVFPPPEYDERELARARASNLLKLTPEEEQKKKFRKQFVLFRLKRKAKKPGNENILSRPWTLDDSLTEMENELDLINQEESVERNAQDLEKWIDAGVKLSKFGSKRFLKRWVDLEDYQVEWDRLQDPLEEIAVRMARRGGRPDPVKEVTKILLGSMALHVLDTKIGGSDAERRNRPSRRNTQSAPIITTHASTTTTTTNTASKTNTTPSEPPVPENVTEKVKVKTVAETEVEPSPPENTVSLGPVTRTGREFKW